MNGTATRISVTARRTGFKAELEDLQTVRDISQPGMPAPGLTLARRDMPARLVQVPPGGGHPARPGELRLARLNP